MGAKADLKIRRYRASDHDAVWHLHNLALHAVGAHVGNGPWDDDLHHIEREYLRGGEFLVGEQGGRIVAMGAIKPLGEHRAEVKRMRVHPDCQRRGFGRAILERLEARAAELGCARLLLHTTVKQTAAQKLYEGFGYVAAGRETLSGFACIRYEKEIQGSNARRGGKGG